MRAALYMAVLVATRRDPGDPHLPLATLSGGEGEEIGAHGFYAGAAHHAQCDGEKPDTVASRRGNGVCGV